MRIVPAHRAISLFALALLLTACSDDDGAETLNSDSASSGNSSSATGGESDFGDDDSEPALDPSRNYPGTSSAAKKDAGSAASARDVSAGGSTASTAQRPDEEVDPDPSTVAPIPPDTGAQPVVQEPVNPFVDASKDPFSTFGADVDTASYDYLRQSLQTYRTLPAPSYVRVEEYVNYFDYAYPTPAPDAPQPFALALAAAPHPMGRSTTLLRVGIQAKAAPPQAGKPANLVFLVDVSGSMASADKLPLVQLLLEESLDVLAPTDLVSIVTYASDTRVRLAPTPVSSRDAIVNVIRSLSAGGSTNGGSGIALAYEQAHAGFNAEGINHVILCTDGDFNLGVTSDDALVQLIKDKRSTGVTLTALGFGHDNLNDSMMERVSNAGNGMYSIVYSQDQAIEYANERLLSTVVHVATDMKIQVEFNPTQVLAYRLVGYEDRAIADDSFRDDKVDGGEVGAGHRVTALYELVLSGGALPAPATAAGLSAGEPSESVREIDPTELVRVKVRSKQVTATDADPASEVVSALKPGEVGGSADQDLAWASAVAAFAELLRKSPYASMSELGAIAGIVTAQSTRDSDRAEFAQLFTTARGMLAPAVP